MEKGLILVMLSLSFPMASHAGAGGMKISCVSSDRNIAVSYEDGAVSPTILEITKKTKTSKTDLKRTNSDIIHNLFISEDLKMFSVAVKAPGIFFHMASLPNTASTTQRAHVPGTQPESMPYEAPTHFKASVAFDTKTAEGWWGDEPFNCVYESY
jgi:hypothetical protein